MFSPVNSLLVRNWKKDVINLVHLPRTKIIPDASPFGLKLETFIRIVKLQYNNVSNDFSKGSSKGKIPFIELNGRQFSDSGLIIEHLIQHFNLDIDANLSPRELAEARALSILVEESLFRNNFKWIATTDKGYLGNIQGLKKFFLQHFGSMKIQSNIKKNLNVQGFSRYLAEEIDDIAKKDLTALSVFLGDKPYFFGDKPTSIDSTVFGLLAQFYITPINSAAIKVFIEQSTPNLVEFFHRIKKEFWSDWEKTCGTLNFNSHKPAPVAETVPPPAKTKPAETTLAETKPVETTPAETKPAETTPAETNPVETAPPETTPAEATTDETTPGETAE